MIKDLTNSRLDRQNILNNEIAIQEIREKTGIKGILWNNKIYLTRDDVAAFYEVDVRTISRYIEQNNEELTQNGYVVLTGKKLQDFISKTSIDFARDINVPSKIRQLGIFDFRAFLNLGMLLSESTKAKVLRQMMLDIVIDLINRKTGGGTKYINQRDKDFIFASIQEDNYRKQFTDSLKKYVEDNNFKYAKFTDMIYVSIFREKAKEYKKILDLKANEKIRDTFYSEILDIIAAYECGLADTIKNESEKLNRILSCKEVESIFNTFEKLALWKPLIKRGRIKMASRDMALRDAFHYQLSEYIQPLDKDEYEKFLGSTNNELEKLMEENKDVLKRLKERK